MTQQTLVLATGNAGKVAEIQALVSALPVKVVTQTSLNVSEAEETGQAFVENSIIKARNACAATNLPALADDSGLVVPALEGAPGVYSARYAGAAASDADNYRKLLQDMSALSGAQRQAYFYCVMVLMRSASDPTPVVCAGAWHGDIALAPMGEQGFGYDPVFVPRGAQVCAAQMSRDEKNAVSHRAQALRDMLPQLVRHFDNTD